MACDPRYHASVATSQAYNSRYDLFLVLFKFLEIFDRYFAGEFEKTFEMLESLESRDIIPLSPDRVQACVDNFDHVPPEISRCNLAQILRLAMHCLNHRYKMIRSQYAASGGTGGGGGYLLGNGLSGVQAQAQAGLLDDIRGKARAIVTYTGMIPYRLPGRTSAELIHVETSMMVM